MAKKVNAGSSKPDYIAFARDELGINLPEDMKREDMYAAIKSELASQGGSEGDLDEEEAAAGSNNSGVVQGSNLEQASVMPQVLTAQHQPLQVTERQADPTHYTIRVAKPPLCTVPDMVITANGVNTQIHFNKPVKVSAAAYFALVDAVELIPAHRDLDSKEWVPAREEPRFSFVVVSEHHE
jgi:hypothetical protein